MATVKFQVTLENCDIEAAQLEEEIANALDGYPEMDEGPIVVSVEPVK